MLNALVGIQKTTVQLKVRNLLMSQFGLNQILNEPTHITKNSSTCIDLLFTSQTNLVIESGMDSSLYPNRQVSIFYDTIFFQVILYFTRILFVMTENHPGSKAKSKKSYMKK